MTTVKHSSKSREHPDRLPVGPLYDLETQPVPRYELAEGEMPPDAAYQIIHDELLLDGSARLNLATFVTTWMEPQAERLMAECARQEHDRQGRVPADGGGRARAASTSSPTCGTRPSRRRRRAARRPARARR